MIDNKLGNKEFKKEPDSEFLLKILNKALIGDFNNFEKELYVDENWKISAKDSNNVIYEENSNLMDILNKGFPDKEISVMNNKDGSQTILII